MSTINESELRSAMLLQYRQQVSQNHDGVRPLVEQLHRVEEKIFLFAPLSDPQAQALKKDRFQLAQEFVGSVVTVFSNSVQKPTSTNETVRRLEKNNSKLKKLAVLLKEDPANNSVAKKIYDALDALPGGPDGCKDLLYWAVWMQGGSPSKGDYGKSEIEKNLELLRVKSHPYIYVKGDSFVDQLLLFTEQQLLIEYQNETVLLLETILGLLNASKPTPALGWLDRLPSQLKTLIYYKVYELSPHRQSVQDWGLKELIRDPNVLLTLRNASTTSLSLIDYILQQQTTLKEHLSIVKDLEEFERLSQLHSFLSQEQKSQLLKSASPKIKGWIHEIEAKERKKLSETPTVPLYQTRGAQMTNEGSCFSLFAPAAQHVDLILTAFGNEEHTIPMQRDPSGIWKTTTPKASRGRTYYYRVTDCNGKQSSRLDPFSFSTIHVRGRSESIVVDRGAFKWSDDPWMEKRKQKDPLASSLTIYKVDVNSWKKGVKNFRELAPLLCEHAKEMNYTHIEFYSLLDHGDEGYPDPFAGYRVRNFFAPNCRFGNTEDLKFLINFLHANDIGASLDWLFNHHCPLSSISNLDGTNLYSKEKIEEWGCPSFDFEKEEVQRFLKASILYWIEECHFEIIRFDAVSRVLRSEKGRQFLRSLIKEIRETHPDIILIAEETDNFPGVTRPLEEGGFGFHLKWDTLGIGDRRNFL
ncbi:MAG: hypothetical protein ACM3JI_00540, partial [Anaerolineae bacterium]